jgi:hypothetical protein
MLAGERTDASPRNAGLCALVVLADPCSTRLTRWVVGVLAGIAFRASPTASPGKWLLIRACAKAIGIDGAHARDQAGHPRSLLKWLITSAFAWGLISAACTQRLVNRFALWTD